MATPPRGAGRPASRASRLVGRLRERRATRKRRPPEAARQEILEAAMRIFEDHHPEEVGLKEVAKAVGVSHALVTHYFGSFGSLVDAVLEARVVSLRQAMLARMADAGSLDRPGELLAALFDALNDPVHKRLWLWTLATERDAAADFFPLRQQGMRLVAERLAAAIAEDAGIAPATIFAEVERTLIAVVSAAYGYTAGKTALIGSLGKTPSRELDRGVQESLGQMMRHHLLRVAAAQASADTSMGPEAEPPPSGAEDLSDATSASKAGTSPPRC
jgi:TetR/AcrR family transcriptional regulator, repressor for neighboring sulfatase